MLCVCTQSISFTYNTWILVITTNVKPKQNKLKHVDKFTLHLYMNARLKHHMIYTMKHTQSWHDNKNIYRHRTYIMYDSISFQGQRMIYSTTSHGLHTSKEDLMSNFLK
jgi:hypothetical protein